MIDNEFTKYLTDRRRVYQSYQQRMNQLERQRIFWDIILCVLFCLGFSLPILFYVAPTEHIEEQ